MYVYSPKGRMKKKGNQHKMKTPTTMPSVLAAFFSRLNFASFPACVCFTAVRHLVDTDDDDVDDVTGVVALRNGIAAVVAAAAPLAVFLLRP